LPIKGWRRLASNERKPAHRGGNSSNGLPNRSLCCSLFWKGAEDPLLVLPVWAASCPVSVCWRPATLPLGRTSQDAGRPHPSSGTRTGAGGPNGTIFLIIPPGEKGPRSGAKWSAPLETKFLRFETRQEQDSVLSRSPALSVRLALVRSPVQDSRQGSVDGRPAAFQAAGSGVSTFSTSFVLIPWNRVR
jgi:hypothetical protein